MLSKNRIFLIYVPIIFQLWIFKIWKSPEPTDILTVGCTFKVNGIQFHAYAIISLILIDALISFMLLIFMNYKKKLNELYEREKIRWYIRLIIYMGYQNTFEYWVGHFSSYQLFLQSQANN